MEWFLLGQTFHINSQKGAGTVLYCVSAGIYNMSEKADFFAQWTLDTCRI